MKRLSKVYIEWSPSFAYVLGLITSDGNLSSDKRHINFTSKDRDLVETFKACLKLNNKIGYKTRGREIEKKYFTLQFGDRNFYDFLLKIGLMPAKSKILSKVKIPKKFFVDFFRGCIDGDGNIGFFKHPESKLPQVRLRLSSASCSFLEWLHLQIKKQFKINGGWITNVNSRSGNICWYLNFGKSDSIKLLEFLYYDGVKDFLARKYKIAKKLLNIHAGVV